MKKETGNFGFDDNSEEIPKRPETPEVNASRTYIEQRIESDADRYGTKGVAIVRFDPNTESFEYRFEFIPLQHLDTIFYDDLRRSINNQLNGGGRDTRSMRLPKEFLAERNERLSKSREITKNLQEGLHKLPDLGLKIVVSSHTIEERVEKGDDDRDYDLRDRKIIDVDFSSSPYNRGMNKRNYRELAPEEIAEPRILEMVREKMAQGVDLVKKRLASLENVQDNREELSQHLQEQALLNGSQEVTIPVFLSHDMTDVERDKKITEYMAAHTLLFMPKVRPASYPRQLTALSAKDEYIDMYKNMGVDITAEAFELPIENANGKNLSTLLNDLKKGEQEKQRSIDESERLNREMALKEAHDAYERERIERELTLEVREKIERELSKLDTLRELVLKIPTLNPEVQKAKSALPIGTLENLKYKYSTQSIGADALKEAEKIEATFLDIIGRKKLNESIHGFKQSVLERLQAFQNVVTQIKTHSEAMMIVRDELVTLDELQKTISQQFLADPWNAKVNVLIDKEVERIVEGL